MQSFSSYLIHQRGRRSSNAVSFRNGPRNYHSSKYATPKILEELCASIQVPKALVVMIQIIVGQGQVLGFGKEEYPHKC